MEGKIPRRRKPVKKLYHISQNINKCWFMNVYFSFFWLHFWLNTNHNSTRCPISNIFESSSKQVYGEVYVRILCVSHLFILLIQKILYLVIQLAYLELYIFILIFPQPSKVNFTFTLKAHYRSAVGGGGWGASEKKFKRDSC